MNILSSVALVTGELLVPKTKLEVVRFVVVRLVTVGVAVHAGIPPEIVKRLLVEAIPSLEFCVAELAYNISPVD